MSKIRYHDLAELAFDFDGTIAASTPIHTQARLLAFKQQAEATGDERYIQIPERIHQEAHLHGQRSVEIISWVLYRAGITKNIDQDFAAEIVGQKNQIYWALAKEGLPEIPGAASFIRKAGDCMPDQLAIVTTGFLDVEVRPFLRRYELTPLFTDKHLVTREDVKKTKPDPEPYQTLINRLAIPADQLLAVEDTARGIESGKRAGSLVVGMATTHTPSELSKLTGCQAPDYIAENFEHLSVMLGVT